LNYRAFLAHWGPVLIYMAVIFFVSSLHQPPLPPGVSDKPAHAFGYFGFGVVIARAFSGGFPPRITAWQALIGLALASCYGITDEVHQHFVPGRSAEVADWMSDSIGSAIGLFGCWAWSIIFARRGF
jgi:VanZ family protein